MKVVELDTQVPNAPTVQPEVSASLPTIDLPDPPSKMLPYPKGSRIKYLPFTYGEIQKYNSSVMSEIDRIEFTMAGIITEGFPKSDLAYYDYLYLSLLRRVTSFSKSQFILNFTCDSCGERNKQTLELGNIEFSDLEIPSLPIIIDLEDNQTLQINPLTVSNYIRLKQEGNEDPIAAYARSVINMSYERAYSVIEKATDELLEVIEEADSLLGFGKQSISCNCKACGAVNNEPLRDILHLVQPFRRSRESIRNRIRFGVS